MNLIDRVKKKVFKSFKDVSVEYHAGGFFIRKHALYLVFKSNDTVIFNEREEGLHPDDNNYDLLIKSLEGGSTQYEIGEITSISDNVLKILVRNTKDYMMLMPSIFIENVVQEDLSEVVLDKRDGQVIVYTLVYTL